jgi:uncharacterized protein (TIGR02145 family)
MKNYLSLLIFTILTVNLVAQDITVSFKSSDAGAVIDSVQAINLATKDTVRLKGNETLTLINLTSGISSMQNMKGSIFPNPCNGSATLQFSTMNEEEVAIQLINSSGQLVMDKKQLLTSGSHNFSVQFPYAGVYIVLARTSNGVLSFKEVSTNTENQKPSLEYSGSTSLVHTEKGSVNYKSAITGKILNYSTGNNIMYTLYSGKNIRVLVDSPTASKTFDVAFYACGDKDGKNYKTVTIGAQTWMAENLAYLPSINSPETYSNTVSCYYVYDYNGTNVSEAKSIANYATYGVLYNWPAAMSACPTGWHLPSEDEWASLSTNLGGDAVAGSKMKSVTGWQSPNNGATNESCFSGLPGGNYIYGYGFGGAGINGSWWISREGDALYAPNRVLNFLDYSFGSIINFSVHDGFSVRCLRD